MENFTVQLKCLFCDCPLQGGADKEYASGDLLECHECKELNDYDALINVAAEEGKGSVAEHLKSEIEVVSKKLFK